MSYVIGSFNIRDFSNKNVDEEGEVINRDFHLIADIIYKEKFDVVAIQEVNSPRALRYLCSLIKKDVFHQWAFDASGKASTTNHDPEGYGFIWNTVKLRLHEFPYKNNPQYYRNQDARDILRSPYYGRFTARGCRGGSNFELRLVNTHIRDATKKSERKEEFDTLVGHVLPRICDYQELSTENEIMPSYTFLLGDFNLSLNESDRARTRIYRITNTGYTGSYRSYVTVQNECTSLRKPNNQETIEECYSNDFDHFTYDTDLETKLHLIPQRVEALSKYFVNDSSPADKLSDYRKKVSDHVPIKLIVDLK